MRQTKSVSFIHHSELHTHTSLYKRAGQLHVLGAGDMDSVSVRTVYGCSDSDPKRVLTW